MGITCRSVYAVKTNIFSPSHPDHHKTFSLSLTGKPSSSPADEYDVGNILISLDGNIPESMALEPHKFRLSLERPSQPGDLKPGAEVVCIITTSDSFSSQVRLHSIAIAQVILFCAGAREHKVLHQQMGTRSCWQDSSCHQTGVDFIISALNWVYTFITSGPLLPL